MVPAWRRAIALLALLCFAASVAPARCAPPSFDDGPRASDVGAMSFALRATVLLNDAEAAALRYVLLEADAPAPSCAEVAQGRGAAGDWVGVRAAGGVAALNGTETALMVRPPPWPQPGVFAGRAYALFVCALNAANGAENSGVAAVEVAMADARLDDAALASLQVQPIAAGGEAGAPLASSPAFASAELEYALEVLDTASVRIAFAPRSLNVLQMAVEGDSETLVELGDSADIAGAVELHVGFGENVLGVRVLAEDGLTEVVYTLRVMRPLSSNALLADMRVAGVALEPAAFDPAQRFYEGAVPYETDEVFVRATAADAHHQAMFVQAVRVQSGERSQGLALAAGDATNVTVEVVAQDARTQVSYTIELTRAEASIDAALSALGVSGHSLSPAFEADTLEYNVTTVFDNAYVALTATVRSELHLDLLVGGRQAYSGVTIVVPVEVGETEIDIVVTPQDERYPRTYTMVVRRLAPSEDATLSALVVSTDDDGRVLGLVPEFASGVLSYTATARARVGGVRFRAFGSQAGDAAGRQTLRSLAHNGQIIEGEQSDLIALQTGENTFTVEVTAEDGETTLTYTVTVTRVALDDDATLQGLTVSAGELEPPFDAGVQQYVVELLWWQTGLQVTPLANQSYHSKLTVGGVPQESASMSRLIDAPVGNSTVEILVVAEDRVTSETYRVQVVREAVPIAADDVTLAALNVEWELEGGELCSTASESLRRELWGRRVRAAAEVARERMAARFTPILSAPADRHKPPPEPPEGGDQPQAPPLPMVVDSSVCRPTGVLSPNFEAGSDAAEYTLLLLSPGRPKVRRAARSAIITDDEGTDNATLAGDDGNATSVSDQQADDATLTDDDGNVTSVTEQNSSATSVGERQPLMPIEVSIVPSNTNSSLYMQTGVGRFQHDFAQPFAVDLGDLLEETVSLRIDGELFEVTRFSFDFRVEAPSLDVRDYRLHFVLLESGALQLPRVQASAEQVAAAAAIQATPFTAQREHEVGLPDFIPPEDLVIIEIISVFPNLDIAMLNDTESLYYWDFVENARTVIAGALGVTRRRVIIISIEAGSVIVTYQVRVQGGELAEKMIPKIEGQKGVTAFNNNPFFAAFGIETEVVTANYFVTEYLSTGIINATFFGFSENATQESAPGGDMELFLMNPVTWDVGYISYRLYFGEPTTSVRIMLTLADPTFHSASLTTVPASVGQEVVSFDFAQGVLSEPIPLAYFDNVVVVTVSDEIYPGAADTTYTLTINRAGESEARLSALLVRSQTITPAFDTSVQAYSAHVPFTFAEASVIATASSETHKRILLRSNLGVEHQLVSGEPSPAVRLRSGRITTLSVEVTAMDGFTRESYAIDIMRDGMNIDSTLKDLHVLHVSDIIPFEPTPYRVRVLLNTSSASNETSASNATDAYNATYEEDYDDGDYAAAVPQYTWAVDTADGVYYATLPPRARSFFVRATANDTLLHSSLSVDGKAVYDRHPSHEIPLLPTIWPPVTQRVNVTCVGQNVSFATTYTVYVGRAFALTGDPSDASLVMIRGEVHGGEDGLLRKDRFELRPVFSQHVTEYVLIASTQVELIELFVTPANGATQLRANRDLFEAEEGFNVSVAVSVESFHSLIQVDTLSQDGRNSITYTIKLQRHGVGVPKYGYDRPNQQRRPGMGRPGGPLINW